MSRVPPRSWNETFGTAYEHLKAGRRAARLGWNSNRVWLEALSDTATVILHKDGVRTDWVPDAGDLISNDWHVFPPLERSLTMTTTPSREAREVAASRLSPASYANVDDYIAAVDKLARYIEHGNFKDTDNQPHVTAAVTNVMNVR
jgi:hypothetical protein